MPLEPAGEARLPERGQRELGRDAGGHRHDLPDEAIRVHEVGDACRGPRRQPAHELRLAEDAILQGHAVAPRALRLLAREEARHVEHPLVAFVRRVRALDVAELALPAELRRAREGLGVEQLGACGAAFLDVAIDAREDVRERPAVADAHPAVVADLEHPPHLGLEIARVPVPLVVRVERGPLRRMRVDLGH